VTEPPDLRVLIVEDQALLAMELEMVLADCGCEVVGSAMDMPGALAAADQARPDLALIDINLLDGISGPRIAERLIADHGAAVVFLTANPEQVPDGFAGALGVMSKPVDEQTIRAVVAFSRQFIRDRTIGDTPRRFRLAPWLAALEEVAPR